MPWIRSSRQRTKAQRARRRIIHAYRHPTRVLQLDDLVMLIGPSRTGQLLELGVSRADGIDFIIHAMPARAKFIR